MQFHEDTSTSADYLRKAVPMMVQRNIPATPYNYALWYAHAKNSNPELSNHLLETFPDADAYNPEKSAELFYQYFVKTHLPVNTKAQDALAVLLSQLFEMVNKTAEGTNKFSHSLQQAMTEVQQSSDPEYIQKTLANLLQDTDTVEQLTTEFQSELQIAREEVETLKKQLQVTEKNSLIDELTQIGNRRAFDQSIHASLADNQNTTCLLLLDLDHFKKCNDTYGHVMGDTILSAMGRLLEKFQNKNIHVTRYGGEEFAIIYNGPAEEAKELAETIRQKVNAIRIKQKKSNTVIDSITVSIGVAEAQTNESIENLKERTDQALYAAKKNGRNQVVFSS